MPPLPAVGFKYETRSELRGDAIDGVPIIMQREKKLLMSNNLNGRKGKSKGHVKCEKTIVENECDISDGSLDGTLIWGWRPFLF